VATAQVLRSRHANNSLEASPGCTGANLGGRFSSTDPGMSPFEGIYDVLDPRIRIWYFQTAKSSACTFRSHRDLHLGLTMVRKARSAARIKWTEFRGANASSNELRQQRPG
jgi:hypothetical protein